MTWYIKSFVNFTVTKLTLKQLQNLTLCLDLWEAAVCRWHELSEPGGFWNSGAEVNRHFPLWTKRAADYLLSAETERVSEFEQRDQKYTNSSLIKMNFNTFLHAWTALLCSVWLQTVIITYRFSSLSNISSFNTDSGSSKSHFPMLPSS